jgi:hypothetical protein
MVQIGGSVGGLCLWAKVDVGFTRVGGGNSKIQNDLVGRAN